ncbi:MFS transporter [Streptomyces sp. NPDC057376]|uniref:MFS transporter n=1 Tax=unclassified Streptomyces TaxID=2593676 RepID=UPI00093EDCDC|nr:MFS transporter [Streptomyces sp. CB02414]OKI86106.1 MFS transporter [Streptomyces sp. CB02414]
MSLNVETPHRDEEAGHSGFGARFAVILIALLWASQLNGLIGLMASNAQSEIAIHYHTTQIAWFSQIGLLVGVFSTPFVVKAAGMYGKKRVLLVITGLGLLGDLIAAVSTNYETLLVGRAISGFYGPSIALVYALARDVFPPRLVGPASGFLGGGMGVLALGGPFLSGWVLDDFGYRGVLWFMVIATAVSLVALLTTVPESPVREARTRMDWAGGILLGGGMASIIYGVGNGEKWGWTSGDTLAFILGGLAALVVFVLVERKAEHPIFPITLLGRRRVWSTFLVLGLIMGAVYAQGTVMNLLVLMPDIPGLSDGLGWTATKNAWVSAPNSLVLLAVSVATGFLARKVDTRLLLGIGGALVAVGIVLISQFHYSVAQMMGLGVISGIGMGIVVALVPIMIIESVKPEEQAIGNGAQNMMQGVMQGVLTQIAFVVVAQNHNVVKGTAFYVDSAFTNGFLLFAGVVAVATLLAFFIPRAKSLDEAETGQAA